MNSGAQSFLGKTVHLTRDINLAGAEWTCIGNENNPFKGSFNGEGHASTGLSITSTESKHGFFGRVVSGTVTDFAIKGSVAGDYDTGGVVGIMEQGIISNVYSEISLTKATEDREGGICGNLAFRSYIEHCTQNARVNSGDQDQSRGGIAGELAYRGMTEYCANYGQISGGGDAQWVGGIVGMTKEKSKVFACVNYGKVFSTGDDYIGGICGDGSVKYCFNAGYVHGDEYVGAVCGADRQHRQVIHSQCLFQGL